MDPANGTVRTTVEVHLHNDAPSDGLPDYVIANRSGAPPGTNLADVAVYTPLRVVDVTVDGEPASVGAGAEYGRNVYWTLVAAPPGRETVVTFRLEGPLDLRDGYRLDLVPQPMATPDEIAVHVEAVEGWEATGQTEHTGRFDTEIALSPGLRRR